jgi:hypothetical protein
MADPAKPDLPPEDRAEIMARTHVAVDAARDQWLRTDAYVRGVVVAMIDDCGNLYLGAAGDRTEKVRGNLRAIIDAIRTAADPSSTEIKLPEVAHG